MPKKLFDAEGLPSLMPLMENAQLRDGFGRTQVSTNPEITGAARLDVTARESLDPSLATFRRGISHWARYQSIYRQVESLKRRFPTRTAPELLTGILLHQRNISFHQQLSVLGGKLRAGGGVLDFFLPDRGLALNIHGAYFHDEAEVKTEWIHMVGQYVSGMRVDSYRYIFDRDLYRYEDGRALDYTLAGMQI